MFLGFSLYTLYTCREMYAYYIQQVNHVNVVIRVRYDYVSVITITGVMTDYDYDYTVPSNIVQLLITIIVITITES